MNAATEAVNNFAGSISNNLITDEHIGNTVVSPIGLVTIISIILAGSEGRTRQQLLNVLNIKENKVEALHYYFQRLLNSLDRKPIDHNGIKSIGDQVLPYSGYNLYTRSVGFISDEVSFEFALLTEKVYKVNIQYSSLGEIERRFLMIKVNNWANESTNGQIERIINKPPNPLDRLSFVNSVLFTAKWAKPFTSEEKGTFFNNGVDAKKVEMMHLRSWLITNFDHVDDEVVDLFELPYVGSSSMVIILPRSKTGVNKIFKGKNLLNKHESLQNLISKVDEGKSKMDCKVTIPKFKIENTINLRENLVSLGAVDMTSLVKSNLIYITGKEVGLYLKQLEHKVKFEINEYGSGNFEPTEEENSHDYEEKKSLQLEFSVDRPFAFVIRDRLSKELFLVGKIAQF